MRKIIAVLLLLVSVNIFALLNNNDIIRNQTKSYAEEQFDPFAVLISKTLNSGLGDVINIRTIKIGAELVLVPINQEGILNDASVSYLPMPYAFAGISISGVVLFARAMVLPVQNAEGKYPFVFGIGAGYEFDSFPLVTIVPTMTYHGTGNIPEMTIHSIGLNTQVRVNLMLINPYANLAVSYTRFNTDIRLINGEKFSYSKMHFHTSLGVKVFLFFLEIGFLPGMSYTGGLSIDF